MDTEEINIKRQEIVKRFGDWSAHTIHLKDAIYTFDRNHPNFENQLAAHAISLHRIVQIVSDTADRPLNTLRVLDLACLEGLYGIEFARHGSEVVGIEGREANIEKARFAKEVLGLENITFYQDDVRNLSVEKYGHFDVVLCLGILYHLDAPDVFTFLENIAEVCQRVAIIDTHVGVKADKSYTYKGHEYYGWTYKEHSPTATKAEKLKWLWSSLDNDYSFWFTRPSLFNFLARAGFTSIYSCQNPAVPGRLADRDTLVAVKGKETELLSTPAAKKLPKAFWPEESQTGLHPSQQTSSEADPQSVFERARSVIRRILG